MAGAPTEASAPAVEPISVEQEAPASASASAEASAPAEVSAPAVEPEPAASAPPAEETPVEETPVEETPPAASVPAEASVPSSVDPASDSPAPVYEELTAEEDPRSPEEWPIRYFPYEGEPCEDRHCGIGGLQGPVECAIYETASGREVYGCADPRTYEHEGCYELTFYTLEGEPYANLNTCDGEEPYAPPEPPEEGLPAEEPPEGGPSEVGGLPAGEAPLGEERPEVEEGPPPAEDSSSATEPAFGESMSPLPPAGGDPPTRETPPSAAPDLHPEKGSLSPSGPFSGVAVGSAVGGAVGAIEEAATGVLEFLADQPIHRPETGGWNLDEVSLADLLFRGWVDLLPAGPPPDVPIDHDSFAVGVSSDGGSGTYYGGPPRPSFPTEPPPALPTAPVTPGGSFALSPGGIGGGGGGGPPPPMLCVFFSVPILGRWDGRLYGLLFRPWKPGSALRPALERPG